MINLFLIFYLVLPFIHFYVDKRIPASFRDYLYFGCFVFWFISTKNIVLSMYSIETNLAIMMFSMCCWVASGLISYKNLAREMK